MICNSKSLRASLLAAAAVTLFAVAVSAQPAPAPAGAPAAAPAGGGRGGRGPTVVGTKIADGQAYATVVELKHQANPADNGKMLLSFEGNGNNGLPIWQSTDHGASWSFVGNAHDPQESDRPRCDMHWQPHLTEMPRTENGIAAGTVLLSESTVCTNPPPGRGTQVMHLRLFGSNDFGKNWNFISTYAEGTGEAPVWEPNLQILDDGKLVEFYSDETHKADGYNQMLGHKVSSDGGKSWGAEVYDTAMKGGVERPGMVIIDRLPNKSWIYNYEDVEGPVQSQVHVKISKDGMNWGNSENRGIAVQTQSGQYPTNTPNVHWFPIGGPKGVIVVTSRASQGPANDSAGNTLFWNNDLGVGPWWEAPTPVQKIGNSRAGWTQAMILQADGKILHVTSSGSPAGGANAGGNAILFNAAKVDFNRYEAENAKPKGVAIMRDASMSNSGKARLGAKDVGKLTFDIYVAKAGKYDLAVNYAGIGFDATPRLMVGGKPVNGTAGPAPVDPDKAAQRNRDLGTRGTGEHKQLSATATLKAGNNTIEIGGGDYALDIDYLEVTPS